jgi:hypothetical protein
MVRTRRAPATQDFRDRDSGSPRHRNVLVLSTIPQSWRPLERARKKSRVKVASSSSLLFTNKEEVATALTGRYGDITMAAAVLKCEPPASV